jgi:hypothetical protein
MSIFITVPRNKCYNMPTCIFYQKMWRFVSPPKKKKLSCDIAQFPFCFCGPWTVVFCIKVFSITCWSIRAYESFQDDMLDHALHRLSCFFNLWVLWGCSKDDKSTTIPEKDKIRARAVEFVSLQCLDTKVGRPARCLLHSIIPLSRSLLDLLAFAASCRSWRASTS